MPSYKLSYFDIKARGEATRLAFHYGGIPFTDDRLSHEQFAKIKDSLPFGQLPVLTIDDKTVIAQEAAILRYVGRLVDLYPTDPLVAAKVDEVVGFVDDLYQALSSSFREQDATRKAALRKIAAEESLPKLLGYLERLLAANGTGYSVGNSLTIADLRLYPVLGWLKSGLLDGIPTELVDRFPNVTKLYQTVDAQEKVVSWNEKHAK